MVSRENIQSIPVIIITMEWLQKCNDCWEDLTTILTCVKDAQASKE